ncbi:hypothetical protein PLESTF_000031200 [Pleodorina starrii]|nr:hypothetical protein PLESTF_000031200 [Pleodorina starrii]
MQQPSNLSRSSSGFLLPRMQQPSPEAGPQAAAASPTADRDAHLASSCSQFTVHVDVSLKALVPEVTPEAAVQLLRMVDRLLTYQKYSAYWSQRPSPLYQVPVNSRHSAMQPATGAASPASAPPAGRAAANTAGLTGRSPLRDGLSSSSSDAATDPQCSSKPRQERPVMRRIVYPRAKVQPNKLVQLSDQLVQLESQLPLGQIMCNRTFVALWHSSKLRDPKAKAQWLEAMGVITNFVDAIPTVDEDEEPDSGAAVGFAAAAVEGSGGNSAGRIHRAATATQISLGIFCPRLGLKLINKHAAAPGLSTVLGGAAESAEAASRSGTSKHPADVLAVMLEDIRFAMPDVYRISVQQIVGF